MQEPLALWLCERPNLLGMNDADIIRGLAQEMLEWKAQTVRLLAEVKKLQTVVAAKDKELEVLKAPAEPAKSAL